MPRVFAPIVITAAALSALAGAARAQSVEFRIIERNGQTLVPTIPGATPDTDAVLNFAVQARVVGGTPSEFLGNFSFNIVASGEADANGTLSKLLISNADGTYAANTANTTNNTVGRGGLAAAYSYLAGINPNFNGLFNTSAGTFTNTPQSQEISLVTGTPSGNSLLLVVDPGGIWNPPMPLDPLIASAYLGTGGNFIDLYRFRYTVINTFAPGFRAATFSLENLAAQIGTGFMFSNGVLNPVQSPAQVSATGTTVFIGTSPSPGVAGSLILAAMLGTTRRRRG